MLLLEQLAELPDAALMGVVDRTGLLASTTQKWPIPEIDVSDTPHYEHFRKNPQDDDIYVSKIQLGKLYNKKVVFFSKRMVDANGDFSGLIVVGVNATYFQKSYEAISSIADQSFLLLHRNGTIIARYPDPVRSGSERMPADSPWHQLSSTGGSYRSPGYFDERARLVSVRPLKKYPIVVNVAVAERAALADWRVAASLILGGILLAGICAAYLLMALSRQYERLKTSRSQLLQNTALLEEANKTIDAALNNMAHGLAMFDANCALVVCNDQLRAIYGLTEADTRPGTPLAQLFSSGILASLFGDLAPELHAEKLQAKLTAGQSITRTIFLPDSRAIAVVLSPLAGGGFVATHQDITHQKRSEHRLRQMAHYDSLTALPNRSAFRIRLAKLIKKVSTERQLLVLALDLDRFKRVNDSLGHAGGDQLLKLAAQRLDSSVGRRGIVARFGGDEFLVALLGTLEDAKALSDKIISTFAQVFSIQDKEISVGISVGIAATSDPESSIDDLVKFADIALYEAKDRGRSTLVVYDSEVEARLLARQTTEAELREALTRGELEVNYQPIVNAQSKSVCGAEGLLRWWHPSRGLIPPSEFIPIAEESSLILQLGEWVLRQACAAAAKWPAHLTVAVNVSAVQLRSKSFVSMVANALGTAGLAANRLELEITESVLLDDAFSMLSTLRQLKSLGVKIALDDFGTGYSSLSYLQTFAFDKVKIDRSFIRFIDVEDGSKAIVEAVIELARRLNVQTVAEGIETEAQEQQLSELGCTMLQGFFYSAALPQSEFFQRFIARAGRTKAA
jgi:diguanylate cyclase (GGDEF)-like protein